MSKLKAEDRLDPAAIPEQQDKFGFAPTLWTGMVGPAGSEVEEIRLAALDGLLGNYRLPLQCFLRAATARFRVNEDWVQDCFQSFVEQKIMKRRLVEEADRTRGRFRDLLKTSLYRFAVDELRRIRQLDSLDDDSNAGLSGALGPTITADQLLAGDIEWAYQVLSQALKLLKAGFATRNQGIHMAVFVRRRLPVLLGDPEIESLDDTVSFVNCSFNKATNRDEISNLQTTTERALRKHFVLVLSDYCSSEEQIQEELAHVCDLLIAGNRQDCYHQKRLEIKRLFVN